MNVNTGAFYTVGLPIYYIFFASVNRDNLMRKTLQLSLPFFFFKMGQSRPLFVYFRYFFITISIIQIEKSIDGVLGIRTRGRKMVGADETTELWRPHHFRCYSEIFFISAAKYR